MAILLAIAAAPVAAQSPARIVSTSPSITETLFALGLGDRVVGVSRYCRFPASVQMLPKIGTFLRPDAELISQLRPDLVVTHGGHTAIASRMQILGLRFIEVERGTLASVYSTIRAIGEAASVADRADRLVSEIEQKLDRVRTAVRPRPKRRVLFIVGRRSGMLADLVAVGRDSYLNDVIRIAGGVNVLDDATLPDYPRISLESIVRLKPEVIVDAADDMGPQMAQTAQMANQPQMAQTAQMANQPQMAQMTQMANQPQMAQMTQMAEQREAIRQRTQALWLAQPLVRGLGARVHVATTEAFVVPGPRVVDAAGLLAAWLHGIEAP